MSVFVPPVRRLFTLLSFAVTGLLVERPAAATVVERVVAVIGERAIFLSDVRARSERFLIQVYQTVPPGAQRAAAISQVYKAVLERIVDEELEERAATQAKITVTPAEVDEALARLAKQNKLTRQQILVEASRNGMTEREYREELRHELLQAKLVNLRLQGRIRVTDDDITTAYRKLEAEERQKLSVKCAWIVVSGPEDVARSRADQVEQAARRQDFAQLAALHSSDPRTRDAGGMLGRLRPNQFAPALARELATLDAGAHSRPIRLGDDYVIFKVYEREASNLPALDEARRELTERVYLDKMRRAQRNWLDGLRRQNHVEVRL